MEKRAFVLGMTLFVCSVFLFASNVFASSFYLKPVQAEEAEEGPAKFHYVVDAGEVIEDQLSLSRKRSKGDGLKENVDLFAVDAHMTANGFLGMSSELDDQELFGSWVEFSETNKLIAKEELVDFTVNIPKNATPGQYVGGFVVISQGEDDVTDDSMAGMEEVRSVSVVRLRYATTVMVDVNGDIIPSYEVQNTSYVIEDNVLSLDFDFHNTGNVVYELQGAFILKGLYDEVEVEVPFRKVLPGEKLHVSEEFIDMYKFITTTDVELVLDVSYSFKDESSSEVFEHEGSVWYLPAKFIVVLLLVFLVMYVIIYGFVRRFTVKWEPYTVKKGEHIFSIAKECHVSWKVLAKKNALTPPYKLKKGQKILIPTHGHGNTSKEKSKK